MMKAYVDSLLLEVTRKCNMGCAHCLRGDAQNLDMSKEIIDRVVEQTQANSVVFTGGEPSLNIPAIRYYFERSRELGGLPFSFWLATNGKENQVELASLLLEMFAEMDNPDACGVAISLDEYHEAIGEKHILKGLSFYSDERERYLYPVVREGRAEKFAGARTNALSKDIVCTSNYGTIQIDTLYVAANGKLIGDCDYSYEHIDELSEYDIWHLDDLFADCTSTCRKAC